jgi:hypothetical protein
MLLKMRVALPLQLAPSKRSYRSAEESLLVEALRAVLWTNCYSLLDFAPEP